MRHVRFSLLILRTGVGLYLLFTAIARIVIPDARDSLVSLYSTLGLAPLEAGAFAMIVTAFILVLGMVLLSGRLLVVAGLFVMLLGLANGASELMLSQIDPSLSSVDRVSLLTLGFRDVLVLAMAGLAISVLDKLSRMAKTPGLPGSVAMLSEERVAAPYRPE